MPAGRGRCLETGSAAGRTALDNYQHADVARSRSDRLGLVPQAHKVGACLLLGPKGVAMLHGQTGAVAGTAVLCGFWKLGALTGELRVLRVSWNMDSGIGTRMAPPWDPCPPSSTEAGNTSLINSARTVPANPASELHLHPKVLSDSSFSLVRTRLMRPHAAFLSPTRPACLR